MSLMGQEREFADRNSGHSALADSRLRLESREAAPDRLLSAAMFAP